LDLDDFGRTNDIKAEHESDFRLDLTRG
jgi:hypothetical protein